MTNMLSTIEPKSDQLNADSLTGGRSLTIKITKVSGNTAEQPIKINYENDGGKPYLPCKSMRRVLVHVWGVDGASYIGKSLTLYCDPKVLWGGVAVGGLRISHMSNINKEVTMALTSSKSNRKPFTVKPLSITPSVPDARDVPSFESSVTQTASNQSGEGEPIEFDDPDILKRGRQEANRGVNLYKTWLANLSDDQKSIIKPHHTELSRIAKQADVNNEEPTI